MENNQQTPPSEKPFSEFLADLDHPDPNRRAEAARFLKQYSHIDTKLNNKLRRIAKTDPVPIVRHEAGKAAGFNWAKNAAWVGAGLWLALNFVTVTGIYILNALGWLRSGMLFAVLLFNLALILYFAFVSRFNHARRIAFGMLAAFGLLLVASPVIIGIILMATCFSMYR